MKPFPWILLVVFLTACAAPKRRPEAANIDVPPQWSTTLTNGGNVADRWWTTFGDEQLSALVDEALANNRDLKSALARLDAAASQARIAGADFFPQADFAFGSQRQQQVFVGLPIPNAGNEVLKTRSTSHRFDFTLSWELDLWGRVRAGRRAALADAEATENDLRAAAQSIAAQTVQAWLAVNEGARQLRLARVTATNYSSTAAQIRERYERGIRSPLDLRLALSSEASALALVARREAEWQTSVRQLEILLGRYPAGKLDAGDRFPSVPPGIPVGLPSALLERRPDLIAAERRLAASNSRVWEAKAAMFPRIALTGSGGRTSSELEDLLSNNFNIWTIAANLAQPLFQGGRLWNNAQAAKARAREGFELYGSTILKAFGEVETRLANEALLERREAALREATRQSQAAERLASERYRSGLEELVTLLEAQRRALDSESSLLAIRRERLDNRVLLHLALGGGFERPRQDLGAAPSQSAR